MWKKYPPKIVKKSHAFHWSVWLIRLPSLHGLNRNDVRITAFATGGDFPLATSHSSYVSAIEVYKLRGQLRAHAILKKRLVKLRIELANKTHGWLLDESGAVRFKNASGSDIKTEVERIEATLRIFGERPVNIDKAVRDMQENFESMKTEVTFP